MAIPVDGVRQVTVCSTTTTFSFSPSHHRRSLGRCCQLAWMAIAAAAASASDGDLCATGAIIRDANDDRECKR